ncbi:hypothetical protein GmRootA79_37250 [Acidovorax sp. A79]
MRPDWAAVNNIEPDTCSLSAIALRAQWWHDLGTGVGGIEAAGAKCATRRRVQGAWQLTTQRYVLMTASWIWNWDSRHQGARVGVRWIREQLFSRPDFDNASQVHHCHAVAKRTHHGEVMADEKKAQPEVGSQLRKKVEDLRLNRYVERRNGFVCDQQPRLRRQCPGNTDALALST